MFASKGMTAMKVKEFKRELGYRWEGFSYRLGWGDWSQRVPHVVKRVVIRQYRQTYGLGCLIETGTCFGDMLASLAPDFAELHSIELSRDLYELASRRFARYPHVRLYHGDSGALLPQILENSNRPSLFWLDAHYSGGFTARGSLDSPIRAELSVIFRQRSAGHVVLIDDARCFDGSGGYPMLSELRELVAAEAPEYRVTVEADIIRLEPPAPAAASSGIAA
jgi:hypothetical protein